MPRGTGLNDEEIGHIKAYRSEGYGFKKIASKIGRSRNVVRNYLRNPEHYGVASNSVKSEMQIKAETQGIVSKQTVWRAIRSSKFITRSKMQRAPKLKDVHKANRLHFARNNMNTDWKQV